MYFFICFNNLNNMFVLVCKLLFCLHFETDSQIVSASDITPEAVSIIDIVINNCLKFII